MVFYLVVVRGEQGAQVGWVLFMSAESLAAAAETLLGETLMREQGHAAAGMPAGGLAAGLLVGDHTLCLKCCRGLMRLPRRAPHINVSKGCLFQDRQTDWVLSCRAQSAHGAVPHLQPGRSCSER